VKIPFAKKIKKAFPEGVSRQPSIGNKVLINHSSRHIGKATGVGSRETNNSRGRFVPPISESIPRSKRRTCSRPII
jgi:hypothetical protein